MAGTDRSAADSLNELLAELQARPHQFGFYQALRRLEAAFADHPRLGASLRAQDDPVRLSQEPSMTFAPATLAKFEPGAPGRPPRLGVQFAGLFGPNGPLPLHLTEYARDRMRNSGDATLVRFVDIFHHRMLSLFYRAWSSAQPTTQFDRPASDRFAAYVGSIAGIGIPSLQGRDAMPDLAKLHFAGRLVAHSRNAEGLEAMLGEFFQLPMKLHEFIGQWIDVPEDCRCVLRGILPAASLGMTTTIGEKVWDCQQKFRIAAGPMSFVDYERLLPGGQSLERLIAVVNNYVGLELEWDLHLILERDEVPATQLGTLGNLGWTSWLVSQPPSVDAADLVLRPSDAVAHRAASRSA
jgi:type VI secretion system protein ImpH